MKKLYFILLSLFLSQLLLAQAPHKFNYQAVIRNNNGTIIANKNVGIRFSIRDNTASGTILYSEKHTATSNAFGLVNLQVGGGTVLSGALSAISWSTGPKFLQVEADANGGTAYTTLGTMELIAVPYALQAEKTTDFTGTLQGEITGLQGATTIGPNKVTNGKIADAAVTASKITDAAITTTKLADNAATTAKIADAAITTTKLADAAVSNVKIADNAVTGIKIADAAINTVKLADNATTTAKIADAAITTTKLADGAVTATKIPATQLVKGVNGLKDEITIAAAGSNTLTVAGNTLTITGSGDIAGVTAGTGLIGGGTTGSVTLSTAYGGNGFQNLSSRSDHTHVGQSWSANTGSVLAMYSNDVNSIGLNTYSYGTNYNAASISAQVLATTGQSVGLFASTSSNDPYAAGVFGQATRSGAAKAIWGYAIGNNTFGIYGDGSGVGSYAGYFQGRVHVNGTLSKAAGSFKIDHPLDPQNKYLSHSFVESPDMMNIYNGNVTLDSRGEATIQLPAYFEALNMEFRYQLTALGKPSPGIYVSQEISNNQFSIAGGTPGGKISWMVTGIRHDQYAREHRIQVEETKTAAERTLPTNTKQSKLAQPITRERGVPPAPVQ